MVATPVHFRAKGLYLVVAEHSGRVLELANGVPHTHGLAPATASDTRPDMLEMEAEGDAGAAYALASSYFGTKEFRRCAHTVQRMRSPRATFLHAYSLFLV
jgi:hypothetical protein